MITGTLPKRGTDGWGSGEFGASRGTRRHKGIDYACCVGTLIESPVYGEVTKIGYQYANDLSYRYVQITDTKGNRHRLFYVEPLVKLGTKVLPGDVIGEAQDIAGKYNDMDRGYMRNHIHYEILTEDGPVNPEKF